MVDPDDGMRHGLILSAINVELRDGRCYKVGVLADAAASRRVACFRQYGVHGTRLEPLLLDRTTVDDAGAEGAVGDAAQRVAHLLQHICIVFGFGKLL